MKTQLIYACLLFLGLYGCSTESFEELDPETPEFYASGQVNGQFFDFQAGNDGYYMFPQIGDNPYVDGSMASGILSPTCGSEFCPQSLQLRYFGANNTTGAINFETGIQPLFKVAQGGQPNEYVATFSSDQIMNPAITTIEWYVDSTIYYGQTMRDTFTGSDHLVCLTLLGQVQPIAQKCLTVSFENEYMCDVFLQASPAGSQNAMAFAESSGEPPFTIHWNQPGVDEIFTFASGGQFFVCATSIDANDCIAIMCTEMTYEGDDVMYEPVGFSFEAEIIPPAISNPQEKFELVYTDENGDSFYSSLYENGNDCDCVDIKSINETYSEVLGQNVLKINFNFSGGLTNAQGDQVFMENVEGQIAFPISW